MGDVHSVVTGWVVRLPIGRPISITQVDPGRPNGHSRAGAGDVPRQAASFRTQSLSRHGSARPSQEAEVMMRHPRRAGRLGPRSRGAAAVEAALVLPVILLIFFAILEFGLLFKDYLSTISAVRAGVRIASAEPRAPTFADDAAKQVQNGSTALDMSSVTALWVYRADPAGNPVGGDASFTSCSTCVKYTWDAAAKKFTTPSLSGWASNTQNACVADPNHDTIGIYLEVKHKAITGAIFSNIIIKEHSVMSLEPIPNTTGCK